MMRNLILTTLLSVGLAFPVAAADLSRQKPISVKVEIGTALGKYGFFPNELTFEAGKLYKLTIKNPSNKFHYFSALHFAAAVWTRKVQTKVSEVKGAVREVEVFPGGSTDWYFVPVQAGTYELVCTKKGHKEAGEVGKITVR